MTADHGPVLPLYLNREEAVILCEAVSLLQRMSQHMVDEDTMTLATAILTWKEGEGAVAKLDQILARARERLPVLQSLMTALLELGQSLDVTACGAVLHYEASEYGPEVEYHCTIPPHGQGNHECWLSTPGPRAGWPGDVLLAEWAS